MGVGPTNRKNPTSHGPSRPGLYGKERVWCVPSTYLNQQIDLTVPSSLQFSVLKMGCAEYGTRYGINRE